MNSATFAVAPSRLLESIHRGLLRSVEPPPAKGSILSDRAYVLTAPGVATRLVVAIKPLIAERSIYSDNFTKGDGSAGIAR